MFLIFGSSGLGLRLAKWCSARKSCTLVGLAEDLPLGEVLENCELIALPASMPLADLPITSNSPTAILFLDEKSISDNDPLATIKRKWPNTPILTTIPIEGDGYDLISIDDISFAAMQDRIRGWERKEGALTLENYLRSISDGSKVTIFCHDNPDPDALASALAMNELFSSHGHISQIVHGGMIEHHQNQAMVKQLEIPVRRLILDWEITDIIKDSDVIVAVDFHRPGANNIMPKDCIPHIIIDHHTVDEMVTADLAMVSSEYSSTSSMVASLLMSSDFEMNSRVATALAFGIKTDTLGFTRNFNAVDVRALLWINAWVDKEKLSLIEMPPRSFEALESFSTALNKKLQIGNLILAPVHNLTNRDSLAQIADFLLPTEGIDIVVAFGIRRGKVILSVRSNKAGLHVGKVLSTNFPDGMAGGHKSLGGGQIPLEVITPRSDDSEENYQHEVMEHTMTILQDIFSE
ncbi:MAG: DHH family phosphoesterase [Candidatus Thermoplasmatota archaeon]|nr:DHH family phosphoesterase [Candidatus Thermoplasmatota archaeon]